MIADFEIPADFTFMSRIRDADGERGDGFPLTRDMLGVVVMRIAGTVDSNGDGLTFVPASVPPAHGAS